MKRKITISVDNIRLDEDFNIFYFDYKVKIDGELKYKGAYSDNFDGSRDEMLEYLNDCYAYDLILESLSNGGLEESE